MYTNRAASFEMEKGENANERKRTCKIYQDYIRNILGFLYQEYIRIQQKPPTQDDFYLKCLLLVAYLTVPPCLCTLFVFCNMNTALKLRQQYIYGVYTMSCFQNSLFLHQAQQGNRKDDCAFAKSLRDLVAKTKSILKLSQRGDIAAARMTIFHKSEQTS